MTKKHVKVKGIVFSGQGVGTSFVKLSWARRQFREKLGFDPYNGTLNLRLSETEAKRLKNTLKRYEGIEIAPKEGFFQARCFKALLINDMEAAVVIPEKPNYPSNVLEIIAPIHLRKVMSLKDNDNFEVTILLEAGIKV